MPRDRATIPPPPSHLDAWLTQFEEALRELRPHVSTKLATTIGRGEYLPDRDPKKAAAAYHARQGGAPPAAKKRKR